MSTHRPRRVPGHLLALCMLACASMSAFAAPAGAAPLRHAPRHSSTGRASNPVATAARTLPPSLASAARHATHADRVLVSDAKALKRCLRIEQAHPARCSAARHALQRAGSRFANAERNLARIARTTGKAGAASASTVQSPLQAPQIAVSGQTLSWARIDGFNTYVFVRKVPGQPDQYSVISGTSITPPPVPGATVRYSVRTTARGSVWATERSIAYPSMTVPVTTPGEPVTTPTGPEPVKAPDQQAAPAITISGQTLGWNSVAGVSTYVFVRKVPGQADQYSEVSGTSVTPPAVPGATVHYSVRTAVNGSAWAPEVLIAYPAAVSSPPPSTPSSPPATEPSSGPFEMGVVSGSAPLYELQFIHAVGAHTARVEFAIGTPASQLEATIAAFAQDGIRVLPLATFYGTLPTPAEAQNVASWAARFGPGGSFWQGKSYPAGTAVTSIEFGNETSYSYQYSDNSSAGYASRAQTYALRFQEAAAAVRGAEPKVGVLAQGDPGNGSGSAWMDNMFKAVPNLGQYVAGWTVHPYGPNWQTIMDKVVSSAQADGAPSSIPLYATEFGLATDNGRCLDDNYGWNKCMSYAEAATTLGSVVGSMHARYGGRLAGLYLYDANDLATSGASTSRENYFGALQNGGSAKGVYTTAVQGLLAANA